MEKFIDQIIKNLETNGFPAKKVSLPTEKMYEIADNKGFSFNAVLDEMKLKHSIHAEIGSEKIIFHRENEKMNENMSENEIYAKVQEMMSKMSPEELQKIQEMVMNMSPEQKEEMMKKAKEMGMA